MHIVQFPPCYSDSVYPNLEEGNWFKGKIWIPHPFRCVHFVGICLSGQIDRSTTLKDKAAKTAMEACCERNLTLTNTFLVE